MTEKKEKKQKFTRKMQIKLLAIFAFVLFMLVVLLSRITYIIGTKGNTYAKQVLSQQNYDSRSIPYRRGEILDRNGIILAKSDLVYNLVLDCQAVNASEDYIEPTIRAVVDQFGLDEDQVRSLITDEATASSQYQVLVKNVTQEQKDAFEESVSTDESLDLTDAQKKERGNVQGLWFEEKYERNYPYDTLASNVIGFSNDSDTGVVGLENYYNSLLNGTNGRTYGYLDEDSEYRKRTIEPEHGKNLVTTLDMTIQEIVENHIADFEETYGDSEKRVKGAANVGVLVMNPNNGEILAMATNGSYNLNDPDDMSKLYSRAQTKKMSDEEYSEALNSMWSNFCVSTSYEPGSVFKPVTVASALECGAVKDGDEFYCDGGEFITDTQINCDNIYGHGEETLEYAIVNSCNDALMQIGMRMGITNFINYQSDFNFGKQTGIDLPNENPGVVYTRNTMHEVELATCTFGQGFTVNMVQEASAFSAVINGGYYYQPHLLRQVRSADGTVEKTVDALLLKQPVSNKTSSLVRRYLTTAVQEGTGRKSQVPGYLTGGKTGTAEKINPETGTRATGKYLVSFIGACPMDDPQVVIYVVVDEPNVADQADSSYAQILFREIATEVFPYLGLYPTEEVTDSLLAFLGLTQEDVVQTPAGEQKAASAETFDAFDSNGRYYTGCYVNTDGQAVSSDGTVLDGVTVEISGNTATITDAYMNVKEVTVNTDTLSAQEENIDPVADNPDIASPPASDADSSDDSSVWAGVTAEDLQEDDNDE